MPNKKPKRTIIKTRSKNKSKSSRYNFIVYLAILLSIIILTIIFVRKIFTPQPTDIMFIGEEKIQLANCGIRDFSIDSFCDTGKIKSYSYVCHGGDQPNNGVTKSVDCINLESAQSEATKSCANHCNNPPATPNPTIPPNCSSWFDGCNTCTVNNGAISGCTKLECKDTTKPPQCLTYSTPQPSPSLTKYCKDNSECQTGQICSITPAGGCKKDSSGRPMACATAPYCRKAEGIDCRTNSDCFDGYTCYQPPMPPCPKGSMCAQVMPQKYCKSISKAKQ